jgi:hypothetical protein
LPHHLKVQEHISGACGHGRSPPLETRRRQ